MKKLFRYLLQGLLYIAPIAITVYILYVIFSFVDGLLQEWLQKFLHISIPGLGLIITIALLIIIGFLGQTFIARPFKSVFSRLLEKIPILKVIYSAFYDLFSAFVGKEKKFNHPVIVRVNLHSDLEKLGFVTEDNLEKLNETDKVAVYFPHSYNFSGELFIVPKTHIRKLDVNSGEMMKFIVSAGLAGMEKSNC